MEVLGSVLAVSLVSFTGLVFLSRGRASLDRVVMYLVSLAAGVLLGGAFFHLIPEAYETLGDTVALPLYVLTGFLAFFFLERFLWAHHHGHGDEPLPWRGLQDPAPEGSTAEAILAERHSRHPEANEPAPTGSGRRVPPGEGAEGRPAGGGGPRVHPVVLMSLVGDGLHNLVDGMIIAAAYATDPGLGVVTTGAVLLHEVPQEVGEFGVLVRGGLSVRRALLLNFLSASTALVGAVAVLVVGGGPGALVSALVPLTAGHFIYIAAADLIPELHHEHDPREAVGHAAVLVLGVAVMLALRLTDGG